jgi:hypothetical protein
MKLVMIAIVAGLAALTATSVPEIKRYLKVRNM